MNSYRFVFYKPENNLSKNELINAVEALKAFDCQVVQYRRGFKFIKVEHDTNVSTADLIAKPEEVTINFVYSKNERTLPFSFLTFPPEVQGSQVMLSIEGGNYDEDPKFASATLESLSETIFNKLTSIFAWGDHEDKIKRLEKGLSFNNFNLDNLAWANIFRNDLAEKIGSDRLNAVSVYKKMDLEKGILLLTRETPT